LPSPSFHPCTHSGALFACSSHLSSPLVYNPVYRRDCHTFTFICLFVYVLDIGRDQALFE
jgi:hypothetical protein